MDIIKGQHPPNIDVIDKQFNVKLKPNMLYAWGDSIYNPSGTDIPDWLVVHEVVHGTRQKDQGGPEKWWEKYLLEPSFRLREEVYAHRAEWGQYVKDNLDRNQRAKYLHFMGQRLSGPIYGKLITVKEAKKYITGIGVV